MSEVRSNRAWRLECEALRAERDEAVAKAERLSRAHGAVARSYAEAVALLRDCRGCGKMNLPLVDRIDAFLAKPEAKP